MPREIADLREKEAQYLEQGYPALLTNQDIVQILQVSIPTVIRMKRDGRLPKKRRVPLREVVKIIVKGM